jgi:hypothetical protein
LILPCRNGQTLPNQVSLFLHRPSMLGSQSIKKDLSPDVC